MAKVKITTDFCKVKKTRKKMQNRNNKEYSRKECERRVINRTLE
jgi:hypothetical protein